MKKCVRNTRGKHCFALAVMTMLAISTALMSVPVYSADGDVTFDLTFFFYFSGIVPGVPPGGFVIVDVYVDASALPDLSLEGMVGWGLYVSVDPEVLTPVGAAGGSVGYFLYNWSDANYPSP
ncbi:MAG: hypothetical protein GWN67_10590, partial [Phycisphaerae bacterium]|nr:hypothetical protein [Phycisphaerae bacterium]NIV93573.1 hypothetical protein [candidate division KSB1 bacterium]